MKSNLVSDEAVAGRSEVQWARSSWTSVVLVCKECSQRSSGPKKLKSKAVASALKATLRDAKPRPRLLMTNCMGLCPKKAIAVAVAGSALETRMAAVQSLSQLPQMALEAGLTLPAQSITRKPVHATPATAIIGTVIVPGT